MTSKIKVDNINKVSDDSNIIKKCGSTITLGASGDSIALASGASQSGFGREGSVNWQTSSIKTATFTAVSGEGYFINQGSQITANLPAGSPGAIVAFSDYARNFSTYNLIVSPDGSEKIGGEPHDAKLTVDGQSATFVYVDSTKGWVNVQNAEDTETGIGPFICATGGTITNSGNCRIHTFTGPGTFTVNRIATCCAAVNNLVSYVVIAGGAGGGGGGVCGAQGGGGGGGAGGYREVVSPGSPYTGSPTQGYPTPGNRITVTATAFPITVGAGGDGQATQHKGESGSVSTFSTITSAGGGGGGAAFGYPPYQPSPGNSADGANGGSGGGGGVADNGSNGNSGSGNTPPTTPAQGTNGGISNPSTISSPFGSYAGAGGGGATAVGGNFAGAPGPGAAGAGGTGATSSINGTPTQRAGGGGGGGAGSSASGGGGAGSPNCVPGTAGTANTGGGGGGAKNKAPSTGGNGGSGVVIIRYKFQ
jgi:hypothetical protein